MTPEPPLLLLLPGGALQSLSKHMSESNGSAHSPRAQGPHSDRQTDCQVLLKAALHHHPPLSPARSRNTPSRPPPQSPDLTLLPSGRSCSGNCRDPFLRSVSSGSSGPIVTEASERPHLHTHGHPHSLSSLPAPSFGTLATSDVVCAYEFPHVGPVCLLQDQPHRSGCLVCSLLYPQHLDECLECSSCSINTRPVDVGEST